MYSQTKYRKRKAIKHYFQLGLELEWNKMTNKLLWRGLSHFSNGHLSPSQLGAWGSWHLRLSLHFFLAHIMYLDIGSMRNNDVRPSEKVGEDKGSLIFRVYYGPKNLNCVFKDTNCFQLKFIPIKRR